MKVSDIIEPRVGKVGRWKIGTFDIETRGENGESALLGKYILGATCKDAKGNTVEFHETPLGMLQYILREQDRRRWFCHNGGNFDFKYFVNDKSVIAWLHDNGYALEVVGGKIAKALMIKKGKKVTLLCDSFKLMNSKLSKLTKGFNVETLKGFIDFDNEDFDEHNEQHLQYLRDDVISLWQVVAKYRQIIVKEFGTDIRCTASSTAFQCWATTIKKKVAKHPRTVSEFCREAYYGGRTECFYQGRALNVNYIDVNSLYAYIMLECGGLHRPYYTNQMSGPGFYRINAKVPLHLKIAPLPYRKPDKTGVIFPVGTFETYASSAEIELARAIGCEVQIQYGYAFDEHDTGLFRTFIEKCIALRMRDYNGALGLAAKFLQNNLYGFFGMQPERDELIFSEGVPEGDDYKPAIDTISGNMIEGLWERKTLNDTVNCIPAFAAWITANARVHLLRAMLAEEAAGNTVLYCDTDSIMMIGQPVSKITPDYGDFKLEYTFDELETITAKTYHGLYDTQEVMRCKGLPAKKMQGHFYQKALQAEEVSVSFTQLYSLSRVARNGGILGTDNATRRMPNIHSITTRTCGENGFTNPIVLGLT